MEVSAWALTRKLHKRHRRAHKGSWYRFGMGGCLKYKSVRHKYRDGFGLLRTGPVIVFLIFYVTSPGDYYGASLHRTLVRRFPLCSLFQVAAGSPNRPQELLNKPQHKLVILKRRASASGEGMKDLYRPAERSEVIFSNLSSIVYPFIRGTSLRSAGRCCYIKGCSMEEIALSVTPLVPSAQ